MIDGCLMTSNCGYDKKERPLITLGEFLQDVAQIDDKREFTRLVNGMINDEIKYLPEPMKSIALKTIEDFKDNYDEWKNYKVYRFTKTGIITLKTRQDEKQDEWLPPTPTLSKKRRGRRG